MLILIAAMSHGRVIGKNGALPWGHGSLRSDQNRFRQIIEGKTIAIGAGTYNPQDDYVKNAKHVYLLTSRDVTASAKLTPLGSLQPILDAAKLEDIYVVGGAGTFAQFMPYADKLELTYIDADYEGDRLFPEFDESEWQTVNEESYLADKDNRHPYKFVTLVKK